MRSNKNIVIQAGWSLDKIDNKYFIPLTHYTYLKYICSKYEEVVLLSSTQNK